MAFRIPFLEKFPVIAILYQRRGKGYTVKMDKARYIQKEGIKIYELKKSGLKFKPSKYENLLHTDRGRPFIMLMEYERGEVVPLSTEDLKEIYEYSEDGQVVIEDMNYECKNKHWFNEPLKKKIGKLRPKVVEFCPYCKTSDIDKFAKPKPCKKLDRIVNLHATDVDMEFWGQMRRWKAEERHKNDSWLVKNKEIVIFTLMFVFGIVCMYYVSMVIGDNTDAIVAAMQNLANQGVAKPPG